MTNDFPLLTTLVLTETDTSGGCASFWPSTISLECTSNTVNKLGVMTKQDPNADTSRRREQGERKANFNKTKLKYKKQES